METLDITFVDQFGHLRLFKGVTQLESVKTETFKVSYNSIVDANTFKVDKEHLKEWFDRIDFDDFSKIIIEKL